MSIELLKEIQSDLAAIKRLQETTLKALGWDQCTICREWIKTDELIENDSIWDGGICEDCRRELDNEDIEDYRPKHPDNKEV